MFDLIAFDADDTLWHNERYYRMGRERFRRILTRYEITDASDERLDEIEVRNLPLYGYGVMSFVLSLIESGITLTGGRFASDDVSELIALGKEMLTAEVELYEHVEETLRKLSAEFPLMLITKGEATNQHAKIARSGIAECFRYIEVVHDKKPATYGAIIQRLGVPPEKFLMVGNSIRSDILPVIEIGGWAALIPNALTWAHEVVEPEQGCCPRMVELASLGDLPGWIKSFNDTINNLFVRTNNP